jgi:16S rRNA (uracil1498-N3)-methyltransferase
VLVDGSGREAPAVVVRVGRTFLETAVESVRAAAPAVLGPIRLFVAAVRSERLAWIVEKATELGAAAVTLIVSERTQRFRAADSVAARLERIAREAAKQAERADWPRIDGPIALRAALGDASGGNVLILDPSGEPFPASLPSGPTFLFVGPEGGWTPAELEEAIRSGGLAVSLAAGKLRAETAAVAALALTRTALARVPH